MGVGVWGCGRVGVWGVLLVVLEPRCWPADDKQPIRAASASRVKEMELVILRLSWESAPKTLTKSSIPTC